MSNSGKPDVSVLTVGFNSKDFLSRCFSSVAAASRACAVEVFFVNNGSDDSEAYLATEFPEVRVVPSRGNVGFAEGNNYLAKRAQGEYLLLLNPDTELYPDAIDVLVSVARKYPQFRLLGGVTVDREGKFQGNAYPSLPSLRSLFRGVMGKGARQIIFEPGEEVHEVEAIHGGFVLVERTYWERLGGLDQTYFLYGEDVDFCKRVRNDGGAIGMVPDSKIFHDIGSGNVFSPTRKRFAATGLAHYMFKHHSRPYAIAAIALLWAVHVSRFALGTVLSPLGGRYRKMAAGYAQNALRPWRWMRGFDAPGADPRRAS